MSTVATIMTSYWDSIEFLINDAVIDNRLDELNVLTDIHGIERVFNQVQNAVATLGRLRCQSSTAEEWLRRNDVVVWSAGIRASG